MTTKHPIDKLPPRAAAGEKILIAGTESEITVLTDRLRERGFAVDPHAGAAGQEVFSLGPGSIVFVATGYALGEYVGMLRHRGLSVEYSDMIPAFALAPRTHEERQKRALERIHAYIGDWELQANLGQVSQDPTHAVNDVVASIQRVFNEEQVDV